jgi:hypothetical protein
MPDIPLIIDDRTSGNLLSSNGAQWRGITDNVMGGISSSKLQVAVEDGKCCLHLSGAVSLENNGGFVQASLDLAVPNFLDATGHQGIEFEVRGNNQTYNVHLRTADTTVVWQSYRAIFFAASHWHVIHLPFDSFLPYRTEKKLDISQLRRLGIVAIGKEMPVELFIGQLFIR